RQNTEHTNVMSDLCYVPDNNGRELLCAIPRMENSYTGKNLAQKHSLIERHSSCIDRLLFIN
ncbi:hypothetical protein PG938_24005, partial [Klebsiella pneumoniae]